MIICPICKIEFEPRVHFRKVCSLECKAKRIKNSRDIQNKKYKEYILEHGKKWIENNREYRNEYIRKHYHENIVRLKGKKYSKNTAPEYLKPIISGLINIRLSKNILKEYGNE
jgi:hypothetical protein